MNPGKRTSPADQRIFNALEKARRKTASPSHLPPSPLHLKSSLLLRAPPTLSQNFHPLIIMQGTVAQRNQLTASTRASSWSWQRMYESTENVYEDVTTSVTKKKGKSDGGKKRKGPPKNPYDEAPQQTTEEKSKTVRFGKARGCHVPGKGNRDNKGRKNDLPVKSDDIISIIRTTNCPKGKWLARDSSNNYGYVAVDHVELDIKEMLELGKKAAGNRKSSNNLMEEEVPWTGSRESNHYPHSESFTDDSEEWTAEDDENLSPTHETANPLAPGGHTRTLSMPDMERDMKHFRSWRRFSTHPYLWHQLPVSLNWSQIPVPRSAVA
ncbi:hypothetical protein INR49_008615 [Caranx melampygus]|nr:hypothetical protein INR49_008615 [Caranx melampygus]